jgi:glutaredoxin-like YruB-family protein
MAHVMIYSTSWCVYCKAEKSFLDEKGVAYQEVNVEEDEAAAQEMVAVSGQMGVPVTVITHDDGEKSVMVGFDQDHLTSELGLAA